MDRINKDNMMMLKSLNDIRPYINHADFKHHEERHSKIKSYRGTHRYVSPDNDPMFVSDLNSLRQDKGSTKGNQSIVSHKMSFRSPVRDSLTSARGRRGLSAVGLPSYGPNTAKTSFKEG